MEYLFVYNESSKAWWLKIDSIDKLVDYHERTSDGRYDRALEMYLHEGHHYEILEKLSLAERIKKMKDKDFKRLQAAIMQAERGDKNILDGFRCLNLEIGMGQMRKLKQYGAIYINPVGGYNFQLQYTQYCRRKNLIFPNFEESDIRIRQFECGKHYYAYIGDVQVRDGNQLKWNTRDEAYKKALELIKLNRRNGESENENG